MGKQKDLFGFQDMRPKLSVKKVITKERMQEIQRLLESKDSLGAAQKLRELRYGLEAIERRISNK